MLLEPLLNVYEKNGNYYTEDLDKSIPNAKNQFMGVKAYVIII